MCVCVCVCVLPVVCVCVCVCVCDKETKKLKFVNYFRLFKELHQEASSKKGKASVSLSADISSALGGISLRY